MIYFDNSSTSFPKAPGVSDAVKDMIDNNCININRGIYNKSEILSELVFDTRERLADFFSFPKCRNVIFTSGITQSINMILKGVLKPGDRVITTAMEHNAVMRPLEQLRKTGVKIDIAKCTADGELDLDCFEAGIKADTKLAVAIHMSNVCGSIMPIAQMGEICRRKKVIFVVDTAQSAGVLPINMQEYNIDVLAFSGHKGLLATQGIGGFIINDSVAERMEPIITGGTGSISNSFEMPSVLPDKFEPGTMNLVGITALNAALKYLEGYQLNEIANHTRNIVKKIYKGLLNIDGVKSVGYTGENVLLSLDFENTDNGNISYLLDKNYGIMTRCGLHCAPIAHKTLGTYPQGVVRISPGLHNTEKEADIFVEAIKEISQ